ncbi:MAG: rRNA ((1518)-N(6)/adenine(1519)-N(6))-dimethyltransferase RsmA [Bacteroidota bacterium]
MKVTPKKALGQHFLRNGAIAMNIAKGLTGHGAYSRVLEIGPGTGALTTCLKTAHPEMHVSAIEVDAESIAYLKMHRILPEDDIFFADFLRAPLTELMGDKFAVIGNFPYNISTQILFRVYDLRDHIPEVVGMFQKEVAMRIASGPGTKDYGILSVLLQLFYDIEYLFTVDAIEFEPPPKVQSGVIRLRRNNTVDPGCDIKLFKTIVKTAFNQRRKTMRNSLKAITPAGFEWPEELASKRPEQLGFQAFVTLTNLFSESH